MSAAEDKVRSSQSQESEQDGKQGLQPELLSSGGPPRRSLSFEGRLLRKALRLLGDPGIEFVLWTGERIRAENVEIASRVHVADRKTLFRIVRDPQMQFGDGYSQGRVRVEGDLVSLLESIYRAGRNVPGSSALKGLSRLLNRGGRHNTLAGSRENIHHHYDIGNEFYSLWLGNTMAYTCAYYPTPEATLEQAQVAKMDHVSRKMRLRSGETVAEAGCGWGGLALHMARHYGVKVRAFNISHEQIVYARERAMREGLARQVEFVEDDYRNITGTYDAFVSVGMLEHVGVENYPELGRVAHRCLPSHGRGLIHSIGRNRPAPLHPWITRRIFPGAYPPALSEMTQIFEPWNFSVLDVENIRLHYARTLMHWLELYESAADKVRAMFDDKFVRMWRLYLAGSIAGFTTGSLQLFQVLFAPQDNNDVPWTRAHLYT